MPSTVSDRARELSLQYYEDALPAHDIYHAKRVHDVAVRLANQHPDHVDRDALAAAAWLHDIGRPLERIDEIDDHGDWAATEATALFEAEDVSDDQLSVIEHCL